MNSWLGYDSTTPKEIPYAAQFVFPYFNGDYAWTGAERAAFPHSGAAWIDVIGNAPDMCSVLQIDGVDQAAINVMLAKARNWIEARNKYGPGTIYVNRANLPAVQRNLAGLNYWFWLATLDGTVCYSAVPGNGGKLAAVQGWGAAQVGLHADLSVILDQGWYTMHGGTL
jgi:hypothetical protein